jgi:uncharacterized protein YcfJ
MSIGSTIGMPFSFVNTATRHAADIDLAFGEPSTRFNERDQYRTQYSGSARAAAGLGTALGTALPIAGAGLWIEHGLKVAGTAPGHGQALGRLVTGAALAGMGAAGVFKLIHVTQDDGNYGAVGASAGIAGGFALADHVVHGTWRGVPLGPLAGLGAAVAGGVGGYFAGKMVHQGKGHIGEHTESTSKTHTGLPGSAEDFGRGVFNHFSDNGPTTQGISLGYTWKMSDSVEHHYSKSEQSGALLGDSLAAVALAAGGMAVTKKVLASGAGNLAARDDGLGSVGKLLARYNVTTFTMDSANNTSEMAAGVFGSKGAGRLVLGGLAAAIGTGVLAHEFHDISNNGRNNGMASVAAGAELAGGVGIALALHRFSPAFQKAPAAAALTGAAAIGVFSAIRTPLASFLNDRKLIATSRGKAEGADEKFAGGLGAVAGGALGFKLGQSLHGPGKWIATAAGAAGGALLGTSWAPTLPDVKTAGLFTAAGAGALGLAALVIPKQHNLKAAAAMVGVGAVLGMAASSTQAKDAGPTPTAGDAPVKIAKSK